MAIANRTQEEVEDIIAALEDVMSRLLEAHKVIITRLEHCLKLRYYVEDARSRARKQLDFYQGALEP